MKRKKPQPNAAVGYFLIVGGGIALISTISTMFVKHDIGLICRGLFVGLLGLSWGLPLVIAARKWKQEAENATAAEVIREREQEKKTKSKLIGRYKPSPVSIVFFSASIAPVILLFISYEIPRTTAGNIGRFDTGLLAALLIYCAISSEMNLRCVIVDEASMSSHGPLRIYRQNLKLSEVGGIRQTKMNNGSTIEVEFRGQWIVFACNRLFKKRVEEVL